MGKAAEMARAEAEQAEAEERELEQDDEQDDEVAPIAEPEQEREWPAEPTEAMFARARELNEAHHADLHAIFGPFVDGFVECEGCGGAGIAPPEPTGPKYAHDPAKQACTVCTGQGLLETGSRREGYAIEECANCNGRGWVGPSNPNAVEAARQAVESVGAGAPAGQAPAAAGVPPAPAVEDPRVTELKALGYAVVAPFKEL